MYKPVKNPNRTGRNVPNRSCQPIANSRLNLARNKGGTRSRSIYMSMKLEVYRVQKYELSVGAKKVQSCTNL